MEIPNGYVETKLGDAIPGGCEILFLYPSSGWNRHRVPDMFTVSLPYGVDDTHVIAAPVANKRTEW